MPRSARKASETDIYHVTMRGAGRRSIFAEDDDKGAWVEILASCADKFQNSIFAWCVMDNHAHMLIKAPLQSLTKCMHLIGTRYASFYNGRHGHVGPVFQERFHSIPVETEEHLLCTVRYIHLNPLDQGVQRSMLSFYEWSSYHEYLQEPEICDTEFILSLFDGESAFAEFHHNNDVSEHLVDIRKYGKRLSDAEALMVIEGCLGKGFADRLSLLDRAPRDLALKQLKRRGLSIRQIERLTGIGRETIRRA